MFVAFEVRVLAASTAASVFCINGNSIFIAFHSPDSNFGSMNSLLRAPKETPPTSHAPYVASVLGLDKDNSCSRACCAYFPGFSSLSLRYLIYIFTPSASIMNLLTSFSTLSGLNDLKSASIFLIKSSRVPTHSKNSVALIPIARESGSTPIVSWGSTSSGIADGKSVDASVATFRVVAIGERIGDPAEENPLAVAIMMATSTNRNKGLLQIVDIVLISVYA
mmetsp:Transcript_19991/g.49742  ORF Transcript_19991/g.49742 Transcript_19991/m.49742 type:complete len:222 (-) Transcript_19991:69-734(-)